MSFSTTIKNRRLELKLGVRELARMTVRAEIPFPIKSAVYISRIESGISKDMPVESITIDKLWGLGIVLGLHPFELFLDSRGYGEFSPMLHVQELTSIKKDTIGGFIRKRRTDMKIRILPACSNTLIWPISAGYWSQIEADFRGCGSKVSGEKLFEIGCSLSTDPLLLYVLSRGMDERYLNHDSLYRLFT